LSNDFTVQITPSYPYLSGEWLGVQKEFTDDSSFRQAVTYRRYHLTTDNVTGDYIWTSYTDYTIYVDLQIATTENPVVEAGQLSAGDAIVFLPVRISKNTSGTLITEFRPQIQDEILFGGVTWKIDKFDIKMFGSTETYLKAYCKRRSSTQPTQNWNSNYTPGRGFD
jgi:hypothetical protein